MALKSTVMKIITSQKIAQLMSNDLLDFHTSRQFFEPNQNSCRIKLLLLEVNTILEESIQNKRR